MPIAKLVFLLFVVAWVVPRDSVDAANVPRISDEVLWGRNGNIKSGDKDQFPPLTAELCAAHDPTALVESAYAAINSPDNDIMSSRFTRSTAGWMVVIVDEDDGEEDGGGTNTYGAYASFVFAGNESLADGVCDDIPQRNGDRMCGADDSSTLNFNLGPADAIAFMACTPPPARYFSYDVDLVARLTEEYPNYPGCNFGDTISNLDMNTTSNVGAGTGGTGTASTASTASTGKGGIFSSPVLIIHAADAEVGEAVKEAYVSSGRIAADAVSIRHFPVDTVRLWDRSQGSSYKDSSPDIFNFIHRISVPLEGYEEEYQKYKQEIWPVKIFFAADSTTATAPTNPALKNRYSENVPNELALFSEPMSLLTQGVLSAYTGTSAGTVDGITREASRAAEESNNTNANNNPNHQALRGSSSYSDRDSDSTSTTSGVSVYKGTSVVNLTGYGFYDDWDTVLAAKNNRSFALGDRDAIYGVPTIWFGDKLMKLYADTAGVLIGVIHSLVQKAKHSTYSRSTICLQAAVRVQRIRSGVWSSTAAASSTRDGCRLRRWCWVSACMESWTPRLVRVQMSQLPVDSLSSATTLCNILLLLLLLLLIIILVLVLVCGYYFNTLAVVQVKSKQFIIPPPTYS